MESRYKLTTIDIAKPALSNWKDVLAHNADVLRYVACIHLHALGAVLMGDLWMTEGISDGCAWFAAFLTFVPANSA